MTQPRIAIVGAGPGGLVLARILSLHGICVEVFERDGWPASRPQGGSLDMHAESGQLALERAGLTAEFRRFARYEDQECRVYSPNGELRLLDTDVSGHDRPEIDRGELRALLIASVPPERIHWGHALIAAVPDADGGWELAFANGVRRPFDLVIGADGARSRLRVLLSDAELVYSGVTLFSLGIPDADVQHPELAALVGRGMMFAVGRRKAILGHRDAHAHLGIYAGLTVPEDWHRRMGDWDDREAARRFLSEQYEGWSSHLLELILRSQSAIAPRPIYALPIGHDWTHRRGLTLLGDAAHLMSPFSGEGANMAMLDAAELAQRLIDCGDWDEAVAAYEAAMFPRAKEAAAGAAEGIREVFAEDGLAHVLEHMGQRRQAAGA